MAYCRTRTDYSRHGDRACCNELVCNDVMKHGYEINLEYVCRNQRFSPSQVVSSELVYPRGAVPNSQLIWIRIELTSGEKQFVTLSLADFYKYIVLPQSNIGGWTDGEVGSDYAGLDSRYKVVDQGSSDEV